MRETVEKNIIKIGDSYKAQRSTGKRYPRSGKVIYQSKSFKTIEEARAFRDQEITNKEPESKDQKSSELEFPSIRRVIVEKKESSYILIISKDVQILKDILKDLDF